MAYSSVSGTPRSNLNTPKRRENRLRTAAPPATPECFTNVCVETPVQTKRRSSKDQKFDEIRNLTVAVRIRPMNARELSCVGVTSAVRVQEQNVIVRSNTIGNSNVGLDHLFQYDHVFSSSDDSSLYYSSQDDVFQEMGIPLLNSTFRGYNACLFAYGQTGSGKSYSMMGADSADIESVDAGIIPRFCRELFTRISQLDLTCMATVEVSYFEIYNEKIHDLLSSSMLHNQRTPLKVREHPIWGPYVVDLSTHLVKSYKELRSWLLMGNKNRATAATAMNEKSSRSHSIFSIELSLSEGANENNSGRRSKVSLVDLAGSERLGNTNNTEEKLRQGVSINKSLLTLGKVISALAEQKKPNQFIPYRESVLTWLLRESLGGNSLTSMLATITPASSNIDETMATLRYACQARSIVNRARINENPHDKLIRELRAEVERLRALRQDYERNSISRVIQIDDSVEQLQELEDLRHKLSETENKLLEAQESWEQQFKETRQKQLQELAEAERRKEELESHVRVMATLDMNVNLSPYRTNFLDELEEMLTEDSTDHQDAQKVIENFKLWLQSSGLNYELSLNSTGTVIYISDVENNKKCFCTIAQVSDIIYDHPQEFLSNLMWTEIPKKVSKTDASVPMKQIYDALNSLQPITESDQNLRLAFAKLNKSFHAFEAAVRNSTQNSQKKVSFRL